jgi:DNA mismatch repair protein MLH1
MNPKNIDVNIHPTKEEVAFLNEDEIIEDLKDEIRKHLLGSNDSRQFQTNHYLLTSGNSGNSNIGNSNNNDDDENNSSQIQSNLFDHNISAISTIDNNNNNSNSQISNDQNKSLLPHQRIRITNHDQSGQIEKYFSPTFKNSISNSSSSSLLMNNEISEPLF